MKRNAVRSRIVQLFDSTLPRRYLTAALLPALKDAIACFGASAAVMSSTGAVDDMFVDWLPDSAEMEVLLDGTERRWRSLSATVATPPPMGALWSLIRKPSDMVLEYHALECWRTRDDGRPEIITLYRSTADGCFSMGEAQFACKLLQPPQVRRRQDEDSNPEFTETRDAAILVADGQGELRHATAKGKGLLLLSTGCPLSFETLDRAERAAIEVLRPWPGINFIDQRQWAQGGSIRVGTSPWGRFVVKRFDNLDVRSDAPMSAFQIQRQEPAIVKFIANLSYMRIGTRQAEIALAVSVGQSTAEMAMALQISPNTVAYHLKQLYQRLEVSDRASLVARIRNYANGLNYPAVQVRDSRSRPVTGRSAWRL